MALPSRVKNRVLKQASFLCVPGHHSLFLGAFTELQKAIVSFVVSVCPSVPMEELGSHWMGFCEILYLIIPYQSYLKSCVLMDCVLIFAYYTDNGVDTP